MSSVDPVPVSSPAPPSDWVRASAREMRHALDAGQISSRELVEAHLLRIADADQVLRAFAELLEDRARREADERDAERRSGRVRGPLHGLPVSVDDCFDLADRATALGMPSRRGELARVDAPMVRALREAGAVLLGRTNASQLLLALECDNPIHGRTANPFSRRHSPGGSSGGQAAALAAGLTPLGVGADLIGGLRVPAHFTGVAGLRPTRGRWPLASARVPLIGRDFLGVQAGPMARTAEDLLFFFDALPAGALGAADPRVPPLEPSRPRELGGLRVGVFTDDGVISPASAVVGAVERAADALRAGGATVVPFQPPALEELYFAMLRVIGSDGGAALVAALGDDPVGESLKPLVQLVRLPGTFRRGLGQLRRLVRDRTASRVLDAFEVRTAAELDASMQRVRSLASDVLLAMDEARLDALLCPPHATPAMIHGASAELLPAASYAAIWSAAGLPAGVVAVTRVHGAEARRDHARGQAEKQARRVDEQSAGLPVGTQIVARPFHDRLVLELLAAIERNVRSDVDFPRTPVEVT